MLCNPGQVSQNCVSLLPSDVCLDVYDNTSGTIEFVLTDSYGEPTDLSDSNVVFTVKDYLGGAIKLTKTNAPGDHTSSTEGMTAFTVDTGDISEGNIGLLSWVYEIRRVGLSPSTVEAVHLSGDFYVYPSVGRA